MKLGSTLSLSLLAPSTRPNLTCAEELMGWWKQRGEQT